MANICVGCGEKISRKNVKRLKKPIELKYASICDRCVGKEKRLSDYVTKDYFGGKVDTLNKVIQHEMIMQKLRRIM